MNWIYFMSWAISVQCCTALKCYFCGTESAHETDQPNTDPRDISSHSGSCHDFETKIVYPIRQYVVNCGDDDHYNGFHYSHASDPNSDESDSKPLCVKFVTRSSLTDQFYTQRGCTPTTTRTGKSHRLGCGPTMMNRDDYMSNGIAGSTGAGESRNAWPGEFNISNVEHICFCDTDYCNQSPNLRPSLCLFLILVHMLIQIYIVAVLK